MTCTNCSATLSDTAKFCDQCGTPKSPPGDEAIALSIVNAWMVDSEYRSFDEMTSTDKRDARAMLAKARELLVAPLQAEVERLKAELEAATTEIGRLRNECDCDAATELRAARTAAANARRDALEDVIESLKDGYGGFPALRARIARMRDASQPAEEMQTPPPSQWSRANQERDAKGNLTKLALALDTIEGNGCDCGTDEQGTCMACRCEAALKEQFDAIARLRDLLNRENDPTVAAFDRQPPARNVEGLARVLAEADGADWENLNDETRETYRIMARAAIAFLDVGPRT